MFMFLCERKRSGVANYLSSSSEEDELDDLGRLSTSRGGGGGAKIVGGRSYKALGSGDDHLRHSNVLTLMSDDEDEI